MKQIFEREGFKIIVIDEPISKNEILEEVELLRDELVKATVDVQRKIIAIWGELHVDEEQILLEMGSNQSDLWWINLYLDKDKSERIEYDSMINLRPRDGNFSRWVDDEEKREQIRQIVYDLIKE